MFLIYRISQSEESLNEALPIFYLSTFNTDFAYVPFEESQRISQVLQEAGLEMRREGMAQRDTFSEAKSA